MEHTYEELKALHRKLRNELPSEINLRVHRALRWLHADIIGHLCAIDYVSIRFFNHA